MNGDIFNICAIMGKNGSNIERVFQMFVMSFNRFSFFSSIWLAERQEREALLAPFLT